MIVTHRSKCLLYLVIAATLWSMGGVVVKSVQWNPLAIAAARGVVATLTISFLARKQIKWSQLNPIQLIGAVLFCINSVTFISATKLTTAANAILLQYTAPVWVALLAPALLGERTSKRDWFFILLTFSGMGLFFFDSISTEGRWGIILAIVSGMSFAGIALCTCFLRGGQPFQIMIFGNLLCASLALFFWRPPWPSIEGIGILIFAGAVQLGLSYFLYTLASSGASSLELVLITTLEPILNPVWVFLVVGEKPGYWALIGGLMVLFTVTIWSLSKARTASNYSEAMTTDQQSS